MNAQDLEAWALRVSEKLQEFCSDAQQAAGNPHGTDQLPDVKHLIDEYKRIAAGQPAWQAMILDSNESGLDKLLLGES